MPYQSILVPLDGDLHSEHALPVALSLAQQSGGSVTLAQVATPKRGVSLAGRQEQARVYLERLLQDIQPQANGAPQTAVLDGSDIAQELLQFAEQISADLIVMTSHERNVRGDGLAGDIKDQVARMANIPVLVVHPQAEEPDYTTPPQFKHILIDLDGTPEDQAILTPALDLGRITGAKFTLLRVSPGPGQVAVITSPDPGLSETVNLQLVDDLLADNKSYLDQLAEPLRAEGLQVVVDAQVDEPGEEVLEVAHAKGVDLIAMSTDTRSELRRWLLRSGKDEVLRKAGVPVLQIRTTRD